MEVARFTMYSPDLEAISMILRDEDLKVTIDEAVQEQEILPGGFVAIERFEMPDGTDIVQATVEAERRHQERMERERAQALLYYWDAAELTRSTPQGVLAATKPAPLSADEISSALHQLAHHPNYKEQLVVAIAEDQEIVSMRSGEVRRGFFDASGD